jgi:FMN phosphatase YigB (HAD superfamily)
MGQEPLAFLPRSVQPGALQFLQACRDRGLRLGALSDYPAEDKLRAMGLLGFFDLVLSAQSPEVGVFKPNPKGLLVSLERLGRPAAESLYVGDRIDVDAAAAGAAGVRCAILTRRTPPPSGPSYIPVSGYRQLQELLAL